MRRLWAQIRSWVVPAIFVGLAALLTLPWTAWVIMEVYERDVAERFRMVAKRVEYQLSAEPAWFMGPNRNSQHLLDSMKAELLGDTTVQAVCYLDSATNSGGYVVRNDSVPIPRTYEAVAQMINADPESYRGAFRWEQNGRLRGLIYVDLSKPEMRRYFRVAYWPLLKKLAALTAVGFILISAAGIFAYHLWGRATWQRKRAEMQQQGLMAERVLTAAVLAHEIRNPLAALRFQIHSLRRNAADTPRVSATADTIDGELSRIQNLVQDYLVHEKAAEMPAVAVELADAVRGLQTLMGDLLRASGTGLVVRSASDQGSDGLVRVACDPHALRQVLMNLVINAQQAMGRGGAITINIGREAGYGLISVSDTGPGIPPEMRDRLFKPFATSKKEGSGIGLALVKRFVDNFGGSVMVESEPGQGATFVLRLPLAQTVGGERTDELAQGRGELG